MLIKMWFVVLVGSCLSFSCNDSSFKSKVPVEQEIPKPATPAVDTGTSVNETPDVTDNHAVSLKVDVVFAIDTSGSMDEEIVATQANLPKMIATLNSGKIDARIHLLLDEPLKLDAALDPNKIAYVRQSVGSFDAIGRLNNLFSGLYKDSYFTLGNQPMTTPLVFRQDAKLEIVVISDDNGKGLGNLAADFDPMNTLKATFNAIIGLPDSNVNNGTCVLAAVGNEYINLATKSAGSALDICSADWSSLITRLSTDIVKRSVTFALSKKPKDPKVLNVSLDDKKLTQADWTYDEKSNSITLLKPETIKDGSRVSIIYKI